MQKHVELRSLPTFHRKKDKVQQGQKTFVCLRTASRMGGGYCTPYENQAPVWYVPVPPSIPAKDRHVAGSSTVLFIARHRYLEQVATERGSRSPWDCVYYFRDNQSNEGRRAE